MSLIARPATLENLEELIQFVTTHARSNDFGPKRITEIQLAVEEALVNIMNYAYPGQTGQVKMACTVKNKNRFVVEVTDHGIPFDILSFEKPDLTSELSRRQIGGLGVFFIRKLANEVQYRRIQDKNILTLSFNMDQA